MHLGVPGSSGSPYLPGIAHVHPQQVHCFASLQAPHGILHDSLWLDHDTGIEILLGLRIS